MRRSLITATIVAIGTYASGVTAHAGTIPYPNPGVINPVIYNFTAAATTTDLIGYFFSSSASDVDQIEMAVNGVVSPNGFGLNNQTSVHGDSFDFGAVTAGDVITFILRNTTTSSDISSVPLANGDLTQHIYSTDFAGDGTIPAGTFVSFEDLLKSQLGSDFDYNDDAFVFANLATTTGDTPIPAALPLFASGLGVIGVLARRRKRTKLAT